MILGSPHYILPIKEEDLLKRVGDENLLRQYLDVKKIPCLIKAPFRKDKKPSLGIQYYNGRIYFKDFARNISGDVVSLIQLIKNYKSRQEVLKDIFDNNKICLNCRYEAPYVKSKLVIKITTRAITQCDKDYWKQFNIDASFLQNYDIYPIQFFWIRGTRFNAETLAYAYRYTADDEVYYKIYQPKSTRYKWFNNYPKDTISLEKYISNDKQKKIIICSSVKDALALKSICDVDVCSLQGEGYKVPNWFKDKYSDRVVCICFDNDEAGLKYAEELSKETGYDNIILPPFDGKDIADFVNIYKNTENINLINNLINK